MCLATFVQALITYPGGTNYGGWIGQKVEDPRCQFRIGKVE